MEDSNSFLNIKTQRCAFEYLHSSDWFSKRTLLHRAIVQQHIIIYFDLIFCANDKQTYKQHLFVRTYF